MIAGRRRRGGRPSASGGVGAAVGRRVGRASGARRRRSAPASGVGRRRRRGGRARRGARASRRRRRPATAWRPATTRAKVAVRPRRDRADGGAARATGRCLHHLTVASSGVRIGHPLDGPPPIGHDGPAPVRATSDAQKLGGVTQNRTVTGALTVVRVPVRQARREGDGVALAQDVVLVADPQVQDAGQDDDDLLVGVVGVRLGARAAARLDRRQDHLQPAGHVRGQELVDGLEARVGDPPARLAADDPAGRRRPRRRAGRSTGPARGRSAGRWRSTGWSRRARPATGSSR